MRREKRHANLLDFVSTLTPRPELVKIFRETVESVWVERYREVDARLSKWQEAVSDLAKRRTKFYQAQHRRQGPHGCLHGAGPPSTLRQLRQNASSIPPGRMKIKINEVWGSVSG